MTILVKNREQYTQTVLDRALTKLNNIQLESVDAVKTTLSFLISREYLYDIRDYIDTLLLNWKDEEIKLEDLDIDE